MKMIDYSLRKRLKVLVLSNAMKPMLNRTKELIKLNHSNLTIRVSIDHYEKEKHEEIRGKNTYDVMLQGLKWLNENNFNYTLATRLLWNEKEEDLRRNFGTFIKNNNLR
jgi:MoaA/NifB/PqqE/SkfB family radical SAM enzyme